MLGRANDIRRERDGVNFAGDFVQDAFGVRARRLQRRDRYQRDQGDDQRVLDQRLAFLPRTGLAQVEDGEEQPSQSELSPFHGLGIGLCRSQLETRCAVVACVSLLGLGVAVDVSRNEKGRSVSCPQSRFGRTAIART